MKQSPALNKVWRDAETLAGSVQGSSRPAILTPEDFLLAMARDEGSDLGGKLVSAGLDVLRLEEAVRTMRPSPG